MEPRAFLGPIKDPSKRLHHRLRLWRLGAHAGALADVSPREISVATEDKLVDLAAICAEAGLAGKAMEFLRLAVEKKENILDERRYIGLIDMVRHLDAGIRAKYEPEISLSEKFRNGRGRFQDIVSDESISLCIVGNSPCERGRGLGAFIDSHDVVIRFNDYSTAPEYSEDYGRKTDIWSRNYTYQNIWRRDSEKFRHTLLPGLSLYWRVPNGYQFLVDHAASGNSAEDVPVRIYHNLMVRVGVPPSSGLLVLYWIFAIRGGLKNVSVFGFSMMDQNGIGPVRYFEDGVVRAKHPPHSWQREWAVFNELIKT